jgi:hypothetical protein
MGGRLDSLGRLPSQKPQQTNGFQVLSPFRRNWPLLKIGAALFDRRWYNSARSGESWLVLVDCPLPLCTGEKKRRALKDELKSTGGGSMCASRAT